MPKGGDGPPGQVHDGPVVVRSESDARNCINLFAAGAGARRAGGVGAGDAGARVRGRGRGGARVTSAHVVGQGGPRVGAGR